jgi:hypothetical protein
MTSKNANQFLYRYNGVEKLGSDPSFPGLFRVAVGTGPQRPTGLVGADDDARGHSLGAEEREFAGRGSIRKDPFASA